MSLYIVRVFLFLILPLLLGLGIILLDRSVNSRERRVEVFLIMLFGIGVGGSGIASFFGHVFLSDIVADSVGWPAGNPFQLEMGFANLALGLLGIIAAGRRDGFREATVIAVSVLGIGASIVHFQDLAATGNMAPGNTIQNIANLIKPAFLIPLLIVSGSEAQSASSSAITAEFDRWRAALLQVAGLVTMIVSMGFAVGYATGNTLVLSMVGTLIAGIATILMLRASPLHRASEQIS